MINNQITITKKNAITNYQIPMIKEKLGAWLLVFIKILHHFSELPEEPV